MELEMLKQKWNEIDNRLSTMETLNRTTVKELMNNRMRTSVDNIMSKDSWGIAALIFIPIIVCYALSKEPVVSCETLVLLCASCYIFLPFQIHRVMILSNYKITDAASKSLSTVLKYRKTLSLERMMYIPVMVVLSYGLIFTERSWILEQGKLLQAILLMTVLLAFIIASMYTGYRQNLNALHDIEEGLKEIRDLE